LVQELYLGVYRDSATLCWFNPALFEFIFYTIIYSIPHSCFRDSSNLHAMGIFFSLVDVCHTSYGIVPCSHVIFTVAECSVITVRYMTIRALAELISIVSPAEPPMQPRSIPVCFGTSRTNASSSCWTSTSKLAWRSCYLNSIAEGFNISCPYTYQEVRIASYMNNPFPIVETKIAAHYLLAFWLTWCIPCVLDFLTLIREISFLFI
jgi:hypothetical protein